MSFWNVVKEVSTAPIRQEADRPFLLGIAGSSTFIDAVFEQLVGPEATPQERALAEARLVRAPGPRARLREIMPVVGTALGWRALARVLMRELAGFIPSGAGLAIRASIAYTGTFAAGRAAVFYYSVGRHPTRIEMRGIRREGATRARTAVREALESLRRPE